MMYGYGLGGSSMMGGFGILSGLFGIVILIDLILLGAWLWKQVNKKDQ